MAAGHELAQFDAKNVRRIHLFVEELDNPHQLRRQHVGDEEHPNTSSAQVGLDRLPELLWLEPWSQRAQQLLQCPVLLRSATLERLAQQWDGPVLHRVGGIVKHLAEYLAADARVRGP